jgi:hypothetical protein
MDRALVRLLNDALRRSFVGGEICLSDGMLNLPEWERLGVIRGVIAAADYILERDPDEEVGTYHKCGNHIVWHIDYYITKGTTYRVLFIQLRSEYES